MAYTKKQRADKGFDFFDDNGKKITIEQYTQATGANGSTLRKELAGAGDKTSQSIIRNDNNQRTIKNLTDFGKTLVSGIQQGAGAAADVAVQGGSLLGRLGVQTNPFTSAPQKDIKLAQYDQSMTSGPTQELRQLIQNQTDLENKKIVGTSDVDASAAKIASGNGSTQDAAAVLGKGLEVANTVTMFANPVNLAKGIPVKQALKLGAQDAALFGGTGGSQAGLQTYGQTGDLGEAAKSAAIGAAVSGVTQGALDVAAPVIGSVVRNASKAPQVVKETVNQARPSVIAAQDPRVVGFDDQYTSLAQQFDTTADVASRQEISKAMAMNRVERLNTQKRVQREIGEGGYVKLPGDNKPKKFGTVEEAYEAKYGYKPNSADTGQLEAMNPRGYQELLNNVDSSLRQTQPSRVTRADDQQIANQYMVDMISAAPKRQASPQVKRVQQIVEEGPTVQTSRFASQTAPNSGSLSPELANAVRKASPEYAVAGNTEAIESSIKRLETDGLEATSNDILARLDKNDVSKQTVSDAISSATALDTLGDAASLRTATEIYDRLSTALTKAGQTVQAANLINRRTPQGMLFDAQRQLNKAGVEINPETRQALLNKASELEKFAPGSPERAAATAEFQREVNSLIPSDIVDKIVGTWKAGLLTGIRTTTGGALSNALFRGLREVSRPGAVAADMVASLFTGKRSSVLTQKGVWSGTGEGLVKAGKYLKSGVDERAFTADGKYIDRELNFKNKALQTYVNGVFRVMGAADRPFYYSQFKNSLAEATIVEAKNLKLKGREFDTYVENGVKNPSDDAAQYATDVANQAVLANDTLLSNGVNGVRQSIEKLENPIVRGSAKLTLGVLAPFTKVPSAFLSRVIDFTPIGAIKEVALQAGKKQLNQAKLVQAISEAGTGTGLIYLGAVLANEGMLTGNYPNDPKEAARWKAEGIIPNAIKVGNTYYSLNYAGPVGALFNVGKAITDATKEGADAVAGAIAGGTQLATGTLEQSFLSGISGALDAIQDPQRYAANFVKSQAGSVVPTLLNDIGNATDEVQRQANTAGEAIISRIPGARTTLNAKSDAFGNELTQANDSVPGRLVDPLRPSKAVESPLTDELSRLKEADQFIYPTTEKTIKVNGETIKLDSDQQKSFNDGLGQETQLIWGNIINSESYQAASDEDKRKMLENAQSDITAVGKKQFLTSIGKTAEAEALTLTKRQQRYEKGTIDPTMWLVKDSDSSTADTKLSKDSGSFSFLNTADIVSTADKPSWNKAPVEEKYTSIIESFNKTLPANLPKLPATNEVAELYAKYEQNVADKGWSDLQKQAELTKVVTDAYKTQLTDNEKFIATLSDDEVYNAVKNGQVSDEEINRLAEMDGILDELGGSAVLGKTLRKNLGLPQLAGSSKSKSGTTKAKKGKVGFKAPKSAAFKRTQSTAAIRKLLAAAGKKLG